MPEEVVSAGVQISGSIPIVFFKKAIRILYKETSAL